MSIARRFVCGALVRVRDLLSVIGCAGRVLERLDINPAQRLAVATSSGIRIIGSVAVAGRSLGRAGRKDRVR